MIGRWLVNVIYRNSLYFIRPEKLIKRKWLRWLKICRFGSRARNLTGAAD